MTNDAVVQAQRLFRFILTSPEWSAATAREKLGMTQLQFDLAQYFLVEAGLLRASDDPSGYTPVSPEAAVARLLEWEEQVATHQLSTVRELRSTMSTLAANLTLLQANARGETGAKLLIGEENICAALESASVRARSEVLSMWAHPAPAQDALDDVVRCTRLAVDRGVVSRTIHLEAMTKVPHGMSYLEELRALGCEVRLAAVLPFQLILVDDSLAYVSTSSREGWSAALEVESRELGRLMRHTFEYCWVHGSTPLEPVDRPDSPMEPSAREAAVLRMLAIGRTDEAIARSLGVSTRTLRRMMTGLMDKLGAESRFQAGVQAAALGLVDYAHSR